MPFDRVSGRPSASVVCSHHRGSTVRQPPPPPLARRHTSAAPAVAPRQGRHAAAAPHSATRHSSAPLTDTATKTARHPQRKKKSRRGNQPPRPAVTPQPRCPGSLSRWRVASSAHWQQPLGRVPRGRRPHVRGVGARAAGVRVASAGHGQVAAPPPRARRLRGTAVPRGAAAGVLGRGRRRRSPVTRRGPRAGRREVQQRTHGGFGSAPTDGQPPALRTAPEHELQASGGWWAQAPPAKARQGWMARQEGHSPSASGARSARWSRWRPSVGRESTVALGTPQVRCEPRARGAGKPPSAVARVGCGKAVLGPLPCLPAAAWGPSSWPAAPRWTTLALWPSARKSGVALTLDWWRAAPTDVVDRPVTLQKKGKRGGTRLARVVGGTAADRGRGF